MKLYKNVNQVMIMCCVQLWFISLSSFQSYDPSLCFMLNLCNAHSCTLHNSLIAHDIFMQRFRSELYVKKMCRLQE